MRTMTLYFLLGPYRQPHACRPFQLSPLRCPAAAGVIVSHAFLRPLTRVVAAPWDLSTTGGVQARAVKGLCAAHQWATKGEGDPEESSVFPVCQHQERTWRSEKDWAEFYFSFLFLFLNSYLFGCITSFIIIIIIFNIFTC